VKKLFLITARSGSKGVPGKNIKLLNGKPLIYYSIKVALNVKNKADIVCVSTDDSEIKKIAEDAGAEVPFLRPTELSSDSATSSDVIIHAIKWYQTCQLNFGCVVLLQPTSPFRKPEHLNAAITLFNRDLDMVVSVKKCSSNPFFKLFVESEEGYLSKLSNDNALRRQDYADCYEFNGSVYVINTDSLLMKKEIKKFTKIKKYLMDEYHSVDIDTLLDFEFAEFLIQKMS